MTTLILTYRNRDITIVKNCLHSLQQQTHDAFKVLLVDYGSQAIYSEALTELVSSYGFVNYISCQTKGELWCKSRAINIALKQCDTDYVFVGDVDMMFHPEFIQRLEGFKQDDVVTYFQVGFLSAKASALCKPFNEYPISFTSTKEATGMSLFKTQDLLAIRGYDEYYKGWGSEDTDVHVRLKQAGNRVVFYDDQVLLLHQWHPKHYRTKDSLEPFHSHLEQVNAEYLALTAQLKKTSANEGYDFGCYEASDYKALKQPDREFSITNQRHLVKGFINGMLLTQNHTVLQLNITLDPEYKSLKHWLKTLLNKKPLVFLSMQDTNDLLLETIVVHLRNKAYSYSFDQKAQVIMLTIKL